MLTQVQDLNPIIKISSETKILSSLVGQAYFVLTLHLFLHVLLTSLSTFLH